MIASRPSPRRTSLEDLKSVDVPVLLMHGEDDQIVPIADAALIGIKLLKHGTLKTSSGPAAWHVHDASGRDKSGLACVYPGVRKRGRIRR